MLAIVLVMFLVLLLAGMPERIHPYNKSTGIDGTDAVDHAFAVFEYKNGISTVRATLTESAVLREGSWSFAAKKELWKLSLLKRRSILLRTRFPSVMCRMRWVRSGPRSYRLRPVATMQ